MTLAAQQMTLEEYLSYSEMSQFDVVVVGAGPAGGHCARMLAKLGHSVLLVERSRTFEQNSFSSAGTPLETLEKFDLPTSVVGSFWRKLVIVTSNKSGVWEAQQPLGAVLDFTKLREFLAADVQTQGGVVWMDHRYISHVREEANTIVQLRRSTTKELITVRTRVLVDATGPARAVMYAKDRQRPEFLRGTGLEYLIEVDASDYDTHADALTFFLGYQWIPRGYSWIFPMERNRLKVGAGLIKAEHKIADYTDSLKPYIERVIQNYIKPKSYQILDIHGSTLEYSLGLKDVYYQENTIAIGDAVSTVNFLGGEGIRHAMVSSEIACHYIHAYLNAQLADFKPYQQEMRQVFLQTWTVSEKLGMKKYLEDSDELVDRVIRYLKPLTLEEVVDILFYYKFEKASKGLFRYLLSQFSTWVRSGLRGRS